jgi:hypothetical protein
MDEEVVEARNRLTGAEKPAVGHALHGTGRAGGRNGETFYPLRHI